MIGSEEKTAIRPSYSGPLLTARFDFIRAAFTQGTL
jgi:hypothetical protein